MKRTLKIVALMLLLSMALTAFVSCARPSGTYVDSGATAMYIFDGKEFTYTFNGVEFRGTFEVVKDDDEMFIRCLVLEQATSNSPLTKVKEPFYIGSEEGMPYSRGETTDGKEYIKISETVYTRIKK